MPGPPPKSRRGVVVSVVLAVLLVAGGGIWFVAGGDGGGNDEAGGGAAEAEVVHKVPMPKVDDETGAMGMWTTDRSFVKTGVQEIVGYPLAGGKPRWKVPLSGNVCWSSSYVTEQGHVAVLFENAEAADPECTEVGLVDVEKGELLWQKRATDSWGDPMDFDEVAMGGGTVAAGGTSGGVAWSNDGQQLWKPGDDDTCSDNGYAGSDQKLVVVRECGDTDPPKLSVATLDPATGADKSTYQLPPGPEYAHVAATDPLVVGVDTGDAEPGTGVTDFLTLDDSAAKGKLVSKIDILRDAYEPSCDAVAVAGCTELAVDRRTQTLYLGSDKTPDDQTDIGNEIVAFDLTSGKKTGRSELEEGVALVPIGLDKGGSVLAYQEATTGEGGGVWRIDPESFEKERLLRHPAESTELEQSFDLDRRMLYADGRLYLGDGKARRLSADVSADRPLALVFGKG
ncbi:hypothetical protein AN216_10980 [Streptomyces oceani]|uniref:Pyrrolo-quinoline quinone repeat domain-containing protein n=1 Tax=Streptomyces oceani TaxID=1075402 RepID=A0A1E7KI94_9ACTN|nr:hypothetical protein AN216_10980 [Streptomyces oceani]